MCMHICREVGGASHGNSPNRAIKRKTNDMEDPLDGDLLLKVMGYLLFKNTQTLICFGSRLE